MKKEIWKDIKFADKGIEYDYTGIYQISNYGRIKSLERVSPTNHLIKEKILKTRYDKDGYEIVTLYKIWLGRKDFKVHRLVAFMFLKNGNPIEYDIVNHKDENPKNNYFSNLNWCSTKENINYGTRNAKVAKAVIQYDLDNNIIRHWNSALEVQKTLGFDSSAIGKCCKGKLKTSRSYKWAYSKEFTK